MPEVTKAYPPGTPCWIDLAVPDQQAALDFYRALFGWQGEPGPPEFGGYATCTLNDKPVAGIMTAIGMGDAPAPAAVWTTYLASDDADASATAIATNGGTIIMPVTDVGTVGRMAIAADPTGAVFGVWQALDFFGANIVNEPGALMWNEVNTTDPAVAGPFYDAVFGLSPGTVEEMPGYTSLNVEGRMVGGMMGAESLPPGTPSHWLVYFAVADTDASVEALVQAGGSVVLAPFDMPVGRMAIVRDSQNAAFALIASIY